MSDEAEGSETETTYLNISTADIKHVVTERDFISMMIDLYRNKPVLWKVKHPQYSDKISRAAAVQEIVQELQQFNPEFDEDKFKKKVNTIRTNFNKQRHKIERAKALGLTDERPALWYYNELLFVLDQDNEEDNNIAASETVNEYHDGFELTEHNLSEQYEQYEPKFLPPGPPAPKRPSLKTSRKRSARAGYNVVSVKRKKVALPDPEPDTEVEAEDKDSGEKEYEENEKEEKPDPEQYMTITTTYYKKPKSRESLLAEIWAKKLEKLTPSQKLHAEKIINDVLYEGELGNLTKNGISFIPSF